MTDDEKGRERGIRTPGTLASTSDFESDPFDHSGSSLVWYLGGPIFRSAKMHVFHQSRKMLL